MSDKVCALSSLNEIICKGVRNYSISDIGDILELDSGEKHLCLTTSELDLYCWGNNQYSAIGNSQSTSAFSWSESPNLINIGSGYELKIIDYCKFIMKKMNCSLAIKKNSKMPNGTPRKLLNCKIAKSYGWRHRYTLEKGFNFTYKDFLRRNIK